MKYFFSLAVAALVLFTPGITRAQEVTLIAPGGMKCPMDQITPGFNRTSGFTVKPTIGAGGATHKQVVSGAAFDVPVVQPPYQDVVASGNVDPKTETPLATVAIVVIVKKGDPRPDISTPDAVKKLLLAAKAISYPDGANGNGGTAGVSFDDTLKKLGIFDEIKAKTKRIQGKSLLKLLTDGDIDVAFTYASEVNDPGVDVVGPLPRAISTPTGLVGFISTHTQSPEAAKALLKYLSGPDGAAAYRACKMQPGS